MPEDSHRPPTGFDPSQAAEAKAISSAEEATARPEAWPAKTGRRMVELAFWGIFGAVTLWLLLENVRLVLEAHFALDEFQYANGAWSIFKGEVIYRDFFEHHLPLLHQILAPLWHGAGDDPTHIASLRLAMLPFFGLALAAGYWLNRDSAGRLAALTLPVLLAIPTLSAMQTQIRPDALSAALFLAALACLQPNQRLAPHVCGLLAGVFFALAAWGTLKAVYFGLPFGAALVADLSLLRRSRQRARPGSGLANANENPDDPADAEPSDRPEEIRLEDTDRSSETSYFLGHPLAFLLGAAVIGLGALLNLWRIGALGAAFEWAFLYNFEHQKVYPGFPWWRNFGQLLQHSLWLLPAAACGVFHTVRRRRADSYPHGDWLLLGALLSTLLSFVWQSAPYLYSLLPFTFVLAIFAARGLALGLASGLAAVWQGGRNRAGTRPALALFALALLGLWVVGELQRTKFAFAKVRESNNDRQMATLARLGQITDPGDPVFHQWAGQISRPSPHFFHFLEASTWRLRGEELRVELVQALVEKGVTVFYHHPLFPRLPAEVRAYLLERFQPMDEDLWIYGQRFSFDEGASATRGDSPNAFVAVRTGTYFISPPEAAQRMRFGGRQPPSPFLSLEKGRYPVEILGREEGEDGDVFVIWLPRDGMPFTPRPELQAPWR